MKMVAKLHKAQGAIVCLGNFLSADLPVESPYTVKRVAIVAFSSNTSLCGAFNANVIKMRTGFERSFIESLQLNHQEDVLDVLRTGVI